MYPKRYIYIYICTKTFTYNIRRFIQMMFAKILVAQLKIR